MKNTNRIPSAKFYQVIVASLSVSPRDAQRHVLAANVATDLINQYMIIDREELPKTTIVPGNGSAPRIEVEGSDSTWAVDGKADLNRKWGLEYLAAAEAMEAYKEPEPITIQVPGNSVVEVSGCPAQTFNFPGELTYVPSPGRTVTITIH